MSYVLDTNVVVDLRDGIERIQDLVANLRSTTSISIVTQLELENGVMTVELPDRFARRHRLDILLKSLPVLPFDDACARAYRLIIEAAGYSRRKLLDRMIAAQAIVHDATLVTLNGPDFRDVPGLKLLEW